MISELIGRVGLWLARKSYGSTFTAQTAIEWYRKYPQIAAAVGWDVGSSWIDRPMGADTAMTISAVFACVRLIAQVEASLPIDIIEDTAAGKRVLNDHPLRRILHRQPNDEMDAMSWRELAMSEVLLLGNHYARRVRRGGTGQTVGIIPWKSGSTHTDRTRDNRLVYLHKDGNEPEKAYLPEDVFHLHVLGDGVNGQSVVSYAKNSLALAQIQDEYVAKFFANGGRKPYYLRKLTKFKDDEQEKQFLQEWAAAYGSVDSLNKAPLIKGDLELHELGMPLEDAQLLTSRQFSVPEVCRWFGVQPHLIGDLSRSTNNNIEHQSIEAVTYGFRFWVTRFEKQAERQLFTANEQDRLSIKHNMSALLRGDFKSRMDGYAVGLNNGLFSIDDCLALEDMNPLPDGAGRARHIPANVQTLPGTGEPTSFEKRALAKAPTGGTNASQ